jgi:hypothetical protein
MNPQFTVLLYSKYSTNSKKILDIIENSGSNLAKSDNLQFLCIDNDIIRERIKQNKQIDISVVPCILIIYPDGGVEKYDDSKAFKWVAARCPVHIPTVAPSPLPSKKTRKKRRVKTQKSIKELVELTDEDVSDIDDEESDMIPSEGRTLIEELPSENENEDNVSDRHKNSKPIRRLRNDSGNYVEDKELFSGTPPNSRPTRKNAIKTTKKKKNGVDILALAKEMERGRGDLNEPPPGHPAGRRL